MKQNIFLIVCFLLLTCSSTDGTRTSGKIPGWLFRAPEVKGKSYAVGISGPTFFQEDAKMNAAENARKELAKSLSSRVQSLYLGLQKSDYKKEQELFLLTVSSWSTDIVILNSQILEIWVDEKAQMPNSQPGTVYALVVIDLEVVREYLQKHIEKPDSSWH